MNTFKVHIKIHLLFLKAIRIFKSTALFPITTDIITNIYWIKDTCLLPVLGVSEVVAATKKELRFWQQKSFFT